MWFVALLAACGPVGDGDADGKLAYDGETYRMTHAVVVDALEVRTLVLGGKGLTCAWARLHLGTGGGDAIDRGPGTYVEVFVEPDGTGWVQESTERVGGGGSGTSLGDIEGELVYATDTTGDFTPTGSGTISFDAEDCGVVQ